MSEADAVLGALDRLLEEERALLRAGRLDALSDLSVRKETLMERLTEVGVPPESRESLAGRIARNQALLDGALAGLRQVSERLGAVRELRRGLETYDREGRRTAMAQPGGVHMERRA